MEKLSYRLEAFEGPLDLLLYLIAKNKLNICDIQIVDLVDQYVAQVNAMQEQDMDVASEFLEMAARLVYMKTVSFNSFVREPAKIELDYTYRGHHSPEELSAAYQNAAGRGKRFIPPPPEAFSGIVTHRIVSVASQIISVLRRLWKSKEIRYNALFEQKREKSELVATFLAVLELVKGKRVRVEGEEENTTIKLINGGGKTWKSKKSAER